MMRKALVAFTTILLLGTYAEASPVIQQVETNSGHTVWLVEDHTLPIVTVKFAFPGSGAAQDPLSKAGLASFTSQMLDEGAGDMNALAFRHALESKAIQFSADAGQDITTVTMQTLSEHKDDALDLFMLALTKPRFDADAVDRIRASIISDLTQLEDKPMYVASRRWKEIAFAGHPYQQPRRGSIESIKSITTEDLRNFAKNHFLTDAKPIISVVGDITEAEVREWDIPEHAAPAKSATTLTEIVLPEGKDTPVIATMNVPQTVVIASMPGLKRSDPGYPALQIVNYILGGDSITSRLGSEVRNKRGLAYSIGTDIEVFDHAALISAGFATRNDQAMEALSLFKTIISDLRDKGLTEQELQSAKSYLIGSFPLQYDTQNELAGMLIGMQYYQLGIDYFDKRAQLLQKVSLAEANALAKKLLSHEPLVVMAGTPKTSPSTQDTPAPKAE